MFGIATTAFGFSEWIFRGYSEFPRQIREGAFDKILLRTRSAFLQVIGERFQFEKGGRVTVGIICIVIATNMLNILWSFNSALVFLFPYLDSKQLLNSIYQMPLWNGLKIASYTFAYDIHDYHYKLKENLNSIAEELVKHRPGIDFKLTVDTAPILERDLAYRAGLGFFGDNAHLINKNYGSNFFNVSSLGFDVIKLTRIIATNAKIKPGRSSYKYSPSILI